MSKVRRSKKEEGKMDIDLNIIDAWEKFTKKIDDVSNNCDKILVDLATETVCYVSGEEKVSNFRNDEVIWIDAPSIVPDAKKQNRVIFLCPFGSIYKYFTYRETDGIIVNYEGSIYDGTLKAAIDKVFGECFDGTGMKSITDFEAYILDKPDIDVVLNDIEGFRNSVKTMNERQELYKSLPNYGIF